MYRIDSSLFWFLEQREVLQSIHLNQATDAQLTYELERTKYVGKETIRAILQCRIERPFTVWFVKL